jgi:beta-aspartyl-peptidase (threonine type)
MDGHLAAATSTGGITGKRWGRIGDSPIIGAGTWADDRTCAVSATGTGEYFIRAAVAHEIASRLRHGGETLEAAAAAAIGEMEALGGTGGVIAVSASGEVAFPFNSAGMYRGLASAAGRTVAIYGDEKC